ncbi:MAG: DUF4115 domain-containing protein [Alphaproteobacteria bacterium]|nr:DUF4115 domain-containing protein [Alphaproteobacteria bacterium]
MNKADPFGDMTPASDLVSGDESASGEPDARAEEPVQADNIGAFLWATRMRAGGDLQEIAKILRIRYGYLVAIEDGRHEDLPGSAYSVGFVRAYADYLGLDGNEVVRRLREETDGTVKKARFEFPMPSSESGLPNGGLLAIAMAMGMVVYGSWYTMTNADRDAVDLIQEVPGRLAVLIQDEDTTPQPSAPIAPSPADPSKPTEVSPDEMVADSSPGNSADAVESEISVEVASITSDQVVSEDIVEVVEQSAVVEVAELPAQGVEESEPAEVEVVTDVAAVVPDVELADVVPQPSEPMPQAESENVQIQVEPELDTPVAEEGSESVARSDVTLAVDIEVAEVEPPATAIEEPITVAPAVAPKVVIEEEPVLTVSVQIPASKPDIPVIDEAESLALLPEAAGVDAEESVVAEEPEPPIVAEAVVSENVSDEPLVIELRAKSDSWIQVRDGNELLLTRLLREGEVYQVPDRQGLTLMTGNAGGLEVFVDGEVMPPLGDVGVVRRGVPLSAERLRSGAAPS